MSVRSFLALAALLLPGLFAEALAQATGPALSLAEAEALALAGDAGLDGLRARAAGLREDAVADAALPDPELQLGIENLPLDSFSRSQDEMTMTTLGLTQRIPPPGSRRAMGQRGAALAEREDAGAAVRALRTRRAVRLAYLDLVEARDRLDLLRSLLHAAETQEALLRGAYGGGSGTQQAVVGAGLDLLRAKDRVLAAESTQQEAREQLARWLGEAAQRPLLAGLPELPPASDAAVVPVHPELARFDAAAAGAQAELALARAAYRPEFAVQGRYGERQARATGGGQVPDMGSVMVSLSLPLFTAGRQDRRLGAAQLRLVAVGHARTDAQRVLETRSARARTRATQLRARLSLYDTGLLPRARLALDSAQAAIAAGTLAPDAQPRSAMTLHELELERVALAAEALRTEFEIAYLEGR